MPFLELVNLRRSVREYLDSPVEKEKIEQCLDAARLAPSACNAQPWRFIVVDDPDMVTKTAQATFDSIIRFNKFTLTAPVIVVACCEPADLSAKLGAQVRRVPYHFIDLGMAVEHFCLQAAELGLGTCILGWLKDNSLRKILSIPKGKKIGLAISVGYPKNNNSVPKKRKPLEEIRTYNSYKN